MKKIKLMALATAVFMGMTGVAMTVQAAGGIEPLRNCNHSWLYMGPGIAFVDISPWQHRVDHWESQYCPRCQVTYKYNEWSEEESHTMRYITNDGDSRYECVYCDYWEYYPITRR